MAVSERLQKCIATGGIGGLFALLEDWPVDELLGLLDDTDNAFNGGLAVIEEWFRKEALKPENFFSKSNSQAINKVVEEKRIELLGMLAEIASVAHYCLNDSAKAGRERE